MVSHGCASHLAEQCDVVMVKKHGLGIGILKSENRP